MRELMSIHSAPLPDDMRGWTPGDVRFWIGTILEYPSLLTFVNQFKIDGLTLLHLSSEQIRSFFNLTHEVQLVKMLAHLQLFRSKTEFTSGIQTLDWWNIYQIHREVLWPLFFGSIFNPRLTLLYTGGKNLRFQLHKYQNCLNGPNFPYKVIPLGTDRFTETLYGFFFRWIATLLFPRLYFLLLASLWTRSNFLPYVLYSMVQVHSQYAEYHLWYSFFFKKRLGGYDLLSFLVIPLFFSALAWSSSKLFHFTLMDLIFYLWFVYHVGHYIYHLYDYFSSKSFFTRKTKP